MNLSLSIQEKQLGMMAWLKQHWVLCLILIIAAAARIHNLMLNAVDWDEANTLAISKMGIRDMFWYSFVHDLHPPGWNLLVALWTMCFGDTDLSLRSFSLLWGWLAVAVAYYLGLEISKSRLVSGLTAFFIALMPLAIRYSHFVTAPSANFTLVLLSWLLFLKLIKTPNSQNILKRPLFWSYAIVSLWTTQLYASGPFFFMFQGLYFLTQFNSIAKEHRFKLLGCGILIVLASIPHVWIVSQPWHMSHLPDLDYVHPLPGIGFFFISPLSLLACNFDLRTDGNDFKLMPPIWMLMSLVSVLYALLIYGFRQLYKKDSASFQSILFIGVLPWVTAYLLSFVGLKLFNFRSLLYTAFPFYFVLAYLGSYLWIDKRKVLAGLLVLSLISAELLLPSPLEKFSSIDWRLYSQNLEKNYKPGDGIVIYLGIFSLPLFRYYDTQNSGYPRYIIDKDPRGRDNPVNQVDRIDKKYFLVSGNAFLRPEIKQAFINFQKEHTRILWMTFQVPPKPIIDLIDCNKPMLEMTETTAKYITCKAMK